MAYARRRRQFALNSTHQQTNARPVTKPLLWSMETVKIWAAKVTFSHNVKDASQGFCWTNKATVSTHTAQKITKVFAWDVLEGMNWTRQQNFATTQSQVVQFTIRQEHNAISVSKTLDWTMEFAQGWKMRDAWFTIQEMRKNVSDAAKYLRLSRGPASICIAERLKIQLNAHDVEKGIRYIRWNTASTRTVCCTIMELVSIVQTTTDFRKVFVSKCWLGALEWSLRLRDAPTVSKVTD